METLNPSLNDLEKIIRYALIYKGISKSLVFAVFENESVDPSILLVENEKLFMESLCQSLIRGFLYKYPSIYIDVKNQRKHENFFLISLYQMTHRLIYMSNLKVDCTSSTEKIYAYRDLKRNLSLYFLEDEIEDLLSV